MTTFVFLGPVFTTACAVLVLLGLWPHRLAHQELTGERGERRRAALDEAAWFRLLDPFIRSIACEIERVPLVNLKRAIETKLVIAGHPLGLDVNEYLSFNALSIAFSLIMGGSIAALSVGSAGSGAVLGAIIGAAVPWFKLDEAARRRIRTICRRLPHAIDLASLAMQAGVDFPGALRQVSDRMGKREPLRFEIRHILRKLNLGHSRKAALGDLSTRVPAPAIRQFVAAVVQAEKQGTPLAKVLSVQAGVLRSRRSQAAEQAAARAAVLILGPLMLIFACVFVILLGPFVIKWLRGELF
jgi:tight adherence protein C